MLDLLLDVDVCISFLSRVLGEVFGFPAFIVGFYDGFFQHLLLVLFCGLPIVRCAMGCLMKRFSGSLGRVVRPNTTSSWFY